MLQSKSKTNKTRFKKSSECIFELEQISFIINEWIDFKLLQADVFGFALYNYILLKICFKTNLVEQLVLLKIGESKHLCIYTIILKHLLLTHNYN